MNLLELDSFFNSILKKENFSKDIALNGIQIQNSAPNKKEIRKVAFAVDACEETAKKAAEQNADVLFTHHGLFWGRCQTITAGHYKRIAAFIKNDIALCSYHIPLDANEEVGNNFGLAKQIFLNDVRPFGKWKGMTLGAIGFLPEPLSLDSLSRALFHEGGQPLHILPFGKKLVRSVAIISGGAGADFEQAIEAGADVFVTGEIGHEEFHAVEEAEFNVIAGGHYRTETVGVSLMQKKVEKELALETIFIDSPTGL